MLPLENTWMKLERAEEHLQALESGVNAFLASNPYTVSRDYDDQDELYRFRINICEKVPPRLGLLAGDAVHNMRAALDALTWQLALLTTSRPRHRTEFPVFAKATAKAKKDINSRLRDIPQKAQDVIKSLQPYHLGQKSETHVLWVLHCLDITDKHKIIPLAQYALRLGTGAGETSLPRGAMGSTDLASGYIELGLKTVGDADPNLEPNIDLNVVFDVPRLLDPINALMLKQIYDYITNDLFFRFSEFFSQPIQTKPSADIP